MRNGMGQTSNSLENSNMIEKVKCLRWEKPANLILQITFAVWNSEIIRPTKFYLSIYHLFLSINFQKCQSKSFGYDMRHISI